MKQTSSLNYSSETPLWSTSDVARYIGCSERHVYVLRKQGMPVLHAGGLARFQPDQVKAWLERTSPLATPFISTSAPSSK
jgi:excisionase family DNA binding protein